MAIYCVYSGGNGTSGVVAGSVPTATEWSNAYQSLSACLTAITEVTGDIIYVAHDHAANYTATTTITNAATGYISIISIDRNNTTTATTLAGAQEYTTGAFSLTYAGSFYGYGLLFDIGRTSTAAATLYIDYFTGDNFSVWDTCVFKVSSTHTACRINLGAPDAQYQSDHRLYNCTFQFGNASQQAVLSSGSRFTLTNCNHSGEITPTTLFFRASRGYADVYASGCAFSLPTNLINVTGDDAPDSWRFVNCKVPTNITNGAWIGTGGAWIELQACSTADRSYDYYLGSAEGTVEDSISQYLTTGGASFLDTSGSSVQLSHAMVSSANASRAFPLKSPWYNALVNTTGGKNFTVKIAYDSATALKNIDCWLEVEYMADANSPITTNTLSAPLVTGTTSLDILATGSNLSDTAEAWTGTSGWTNKKTATLTITATVNQIGWARARVCLAKASTTIYVDPKLGVT